MSTDVHAIAEEVAKVMPTVWFVRSPICTREEAMAYCRIGSVRSWNRFCSRQKLTPLSVGRYSRVKVERAAEREDRNKLAA